MACQCPSIINSYKKANTDNINHLLGQPVFWNEGNWNEKNEHLKIVSGQNNGGIHY